ncbi:MAG: hypothetical protein AAGC67_10615, partial [Myxococcota bacterium]
AGGFFASSKHALMREWLAPGAPIVNITSRDGLGYDAAGANAQSVEQVFERLDLSNDSKAVYTGEVNGLGIGFGDVMLYEPLP